MMPNQEAEDQGIKTCSMCDKCWKTLHDFLHDGSLLFNGYQPSFVRPEKGCFLFLHDKKNCGTTFSVEVQKFKSLLKREVDFLPFAASEDPECDLRCARETDLTPCSAKNCNGVVIREIMQIVKQYIRTPPVSLSEDEIDQIINGAAEKRRD